MEKETTKITISVRNLVEFILRSGSIDNREGRMDTGDAMQKGSRVHRKIQKSMGPSYAAEVPLKLTVPLHRDESDFDLCIEGRADGIITLSEEDKILTLALDEGDAEPAAAREISVTIDEIKGVYCDLARLEGPFPLHRAQAMCYAYMYAELYHHEAIAIRVTYCNIETEVIRYFDEQFTYQELKSWFDYLTTEYGKWAAWQYQWTGRRNDSIRGMAFPFPYREGQKELVTGVYRTIIRDKKLFIEAPTGVGKTISTVFPTVKAMGEGYVEKIFYSTAKTITRTVAEETFRILKEKGLRFKLVTLTAKDKICILDQPDCNPDACPRANGHYDRVNDAVFDMLMNEEEVSRENITLYAERHCVCPFEMALDVTLWADGIICDYNYIFDPNCYLRRFFSVDRPQKYAFLVDEAHNLVDRAREMYSASLYKQEFLDVKRIVKEKNNRFANCIAACNTDLLQMKRECDECEVWADINGFALHLMHLMSEFEEFLKERMAPDEKEAVFRFYLNIRHFLHMYELLDENYLIFSDYDETGEFRLRLLCMDPSKNIQACLNKGKSTVMFSATLLPIQYYKEQLGGSQEDYAVYAPSPFSTENRLLMIGKDVSTKYTRRGEAEYRKIFEYIEAFTSAKMGNYFVFFPSYSMMQAVADVAAGQLPGLVMQSSSMTEPEKEAFLEAFTADATETRIGFCVMGGIFSEGIDLKNDRLIGAVIVGTGLPMVCNERELFRGFYDDRNNHGFDYAYLYSGMNKVQQSAGRVIRTVEDRGCILLLDERFVQKQYQELFPREWYPHEIVNKERMKELLAAFWK